MKRLEAVAVMLAVVVGLGLGVLGWQAAANLGQLGAEPGLLSTVTERGLTVETQTRIVRRVEQGHVITLPSGVQVVHVPVLLVRTATRTITVPPHNVPLVARDRAAPRSVVTVTVTVPVPVTQTVTST